MKHIVFKNDYVIAVCKDKEVADLYVKFLEEKEKDSQRKRREEGTLFWNYRNSFYVKSILDDIENKVSSIFDEFGKSGLMICQKLEKE